MRVPGREAGHAAWVFSRSAAGPACDATASPRVGRGAGSPICCPSCSPGGRCLLSAPCASEAVSPLDSSTLLKHVKLEQETVEGLSQPEMVGAGLILGQRLPAERTRGRRPAGLLSLASPGGFGQKKKKKCIWVDVTLRTLFSEHRLVDTRCRGRQGS